MTTTAAPGDRVALFDFVMELWDKRQGASRRRELAERLADSLLGESRYLWDLYLSFDPFENSAAEVSLRKMFEEWAQTTEAALERLEPFARACGGVAAVEQLGHQFGRTRAMLSIPFAALERAREQSRNGQTYSAEEVRRELRLRPRS